MIEPTSVPVRPKQVIYRIVDDEAMVLRLDDAECLGLDEVGAAVFDRVDGVATVAEIVDQLHAIYEVERPQLERDVLDFLQQLLDADILELASR